MTFGHAVAVIPSVLGQRLQIGMARSDAALLHVVLADHPRHAVRRCRCAGGGGVSHGIVFGALAWRPFARATKMSEAGIDYRRRAALDHPRGADGRARHLLDWLLTTPPLLVTVASAVLAALVVWHMRPLYLEFGPVRTLYDRVVRWPLRLAGSGGLVTADPTRGRRSSFATAAGSNAASIALRARIPCPAPHLLRSLHEAVLDRWPGDHLVSTLAQRRACAARGSASDA